MENTSTYLKEFYRKNPPQHQNIHPGIEADMNPRPIFEHPEYNKIGKKLENKVALITGGDSGIGRAVAIAYAKEGADVAIIYFNEDQDAEETKKVVDAQGRKCMLIKGDITDENFCNNAVENVVKTFGKLNVLINNAAIQMVQNSITDITSEQFEKTFKTNIFGAFYLSKAALNHLKEGDCIINTSSITAYKGHETLLDYSSTKGAIATFTRSLALQLAPKKIRVNAVAPGPIWTPLIPSSFDEQKVGEFGNNTPLGRCGQPVELAQAYVFLASNDASFMTGQTMHINGGEIING
ncbi:MAG: SDR family oxidoreductase [Clostridiaceae bacterium]